MRIALDAMGGDFGPRVVLAGAHSAMAAYPQITRLLLTGDEAAIKDVMASLRFIDPRVAIVHCTEVVEMTDSAVNAIRRKKDSSIAVATDMVKSGEADAVVSAGHTGAAVAAATIKLRTLRGIDRPAIGTPFPNVQGGICLLIDAGASVDSRPLHLFQQAVMGTVFMRAAYGIGRPIVGLLSNGGEEGKGNDLTKQVFAMLRDAPRLHFKGNIEGDDLANSAVHVAVCDGFTGNILLKGAEGTARAMLKLMKTALTANPWRKLLGLLIRRALRDGFAPMNYERYGGSPLLGVNGVAIIAHGSSSPMAIQNALRVAMETVRAGVNAEIEREMDLCAPPA